MSNYYEDCMPQNTNKDDYLKYYIDESLSTYEKLNYIRKKGDAMQRKALIRNLIIYEKDSFFSSLIELILNDLSIWEPETALLFPKSLFEIITNVNFILDKQLFNNIFKHIITSIFKGSEKSRNEYTFYFNKIIEFYNIVDTKNNNKIKKNFFPYEISDEIINMIDNLGKFGESWENKKISCYLCSSLFRIMVKIDDNNNNLNNNNIRKLYSRFAFLFSQVDKKLEAQMVRELLYIIPIFKDDLLSNSEIDQSIECYIKNDHDHIIQVMAINSVLKNIAYLFHETNYIQTLLYKIKDIVEDVDYEFLYKNTILYILINVLYNNYQLLESSLIEQVFKMEILKNYSNFHKLDIFLIKNFDKYYFLLNYISEGNSINQYDESNNDINNKTEEYFIKIYDALYLDNNEKKDNKDNTENQSNINDNKNNIQEIYGNKPKEKIDESNLIFEEFYLEENINTIFDIEKQMYNKIYSIEILKKTLYFNLPKIIECMPNLKDNRSLSDKFLALFNKNNIIYALDTYAQSMEYFEKNKKDLNDHPLYQLFVFLLKNNLNFFNHHTKYSNSKSTYVKENKETFPNNNNLNLYNNIYNKIIASIITNTNAIYSESPNMLNNKILILIAKMIKALIPKFYKYFKTITFNKIINNPNNDSFLGDKKIVKMCYYEKIFEDIFTNFIHKIISNDKFGNQIKKEYIEIIPFFILYSKNRTNYYEIFVDEILFSNTFYIRKYSLHFFEQCFNIFSFKFFQENNILNDFIILMRDKVNLISTNAIELVFKHIKKIISYSEKVFKDICLILNEIYNQNIKAFEDKNKGDIRFDKEKNIIINKILNICNNIPAYYSKKDIEEEKENENLLIQMENEILDNRSKSYNKTTNNKIEQNKMNSNNIQLIKNNDNISTFNSTNFITKQRGKAPTFIENRNSLHLADIKKEKNQKIFQILDKSSSGLFKEKKPPTKNDVILINKTKSSKNNDINLNKFSNNYRFHSTSKNIVSSNNNKFLLPKLRGVRANRKDFNYFKHNIHSIDITVSKNEENEENYNENKNVNKTNINNVKIKIKDNKIRIPSAKINVLNSYPVMPINNAQYENLLNYKSNENEKKNCSNNLNGHNLRYSINSLNYNKVENFKNLSNKNATNINRPSSKKIKKEQKIYIDANANCKI